LVRLLEQRGYSFTWGLKRPKQPINFSIGILFDIFYAFKRALERLSPASINQRKLGMPISDEIRRLTKKWNGGMGWPKRLNWLEVNGLRGWSGERLDLAYPIVAIVGENGSGKSTLLQAAASIYRSSDRQRTKYASDFFPDTAWDKVWNASVKFGYFEGSAHKESSIRKPTSRWLGNVERPIREVEYIDLSRKQPVAARVG